ncbi:hypothetical protein KI809_06075 [Geobacter pelophilus]|uniref:DUF4398 domain-containing protein n=1 Tax=Geoanaerobacter pelophilus TaxID=60036 RepID=A0AAW4L5M6_9BACT|nr:hypothetical protein [Geoanaerobacter pelophilus]MBT0663865.1 hypothetical protein [Geoanaerobacter pelophilus]
MRIAIAAALITFSVGSTFSFAADREGSRLLIEKSQTAVEQMREKAGANKAATADLDTALRYLDKASVALKQGEKMFGGLADEAEQEIRHQATLVELTLKLADSRLERAKTEAELAVLHKKADAVKAKVKVFDDLRGEIARLKDDLAKNDKVGKELAALKAERDALAAQVKQLNTDQELREKLQAENETLKKALGQLQAESKKAAPPEQSEITQPKPKEVASPPVKPAPTPVAPEPDAEQKPLLEEIIVQPETPATSK